MADKRFSKNTKNESFVNKWHDLQNKDVINNSFMLKTIDDKLVNYDKSKSLEENNVDTADILEECYKNIWFFFREVLRIPAVFFSKNNYVKNSPEFFLTETSAEMIYAYDNDISMTMYSPDTEGKTTLLRSLFLYNLILNNLDIIYVSKNTEHEMERMKNIIDANSMLTLNTTLSSINLSDYVLSPTGAYSRLLTTLKDTGPGTTRVFISSLRDEGGMSNDYTNILSIISGNDDVLVYEESSMTCKNPNLSEKICDNLRFVNINSEKDLYDRLDFVYFKNKMCKQSALITKDL